MGVAKTIALSPAKQPQACLNSVLKVANIPVDPFGEWQAVLKQPLTMLIYTDFKISYYNLYKAIFPHNNYDPEKNTLTQHTITITF